MRPVPQQAYPFLRKQEGLVLRVYDDERSDVVLKPGDKVLGTLTAGYGHTGGLQIGQKVTKAHAEAWLRKDAERAAAAVRERIGDAVEELTDNQYAALIDFVFNLGTGDPEKPEWGIWRRLKRRQFDQVPLELMRFVHAYGKKNKGLVNRRAAEVQLWSMDEPGSEDRDLPSSVTRAIDTPPTSLDPTPAHKSGSIIAGAAGSVAAAPVMFRQVSEAIAPYSDSSDVVQTVLGILATAAAACAALSLALMWLHKRHART
jgi:GH24 family phage-related lysozyme (muramidase)